MAVAAIKHIFNKLHYEMTRKIAEGGLGVVYKAVQLGAGNFRKVVAVKLIRVEYSALEQYSASTSKIFLKCATPSSPPFPPDTPM